MIIIRHSITRHAHTQYSSLAKWVTNWIGPSAEIAGMEGRRRARPEVEGLRRTTVFAGQNNNNNNKFDDGNKKKRKKNVIIFPSYFYRATRNSIRPVRFFFFKWQMRAHSAFRKRRLCLFLYAFSTRIFNGTTEGRKYPLPSPPSTPSRRTYNATG